jgi:hypothetical protein
LISGNIIWQNQAGVKLFCQISGWQIGCWVNAATIVTPDTICAAMPTSPYNQALNRLDPAVRAVVEAGIAGLAGQLQANIGNETALALDDFVALLQHFHTESVAPTTAPHAMTDAWKNACFAHSRKGKIVPDALWPIILGRVKSLKDHAAELADLSMGDFNAKEAAGLLRKHAGAKSAPAGFVAFLREAKLGRYTLWATFALPDTTKIPFSDLPKSHAGVCAALGLQWAEPLVGLAWDHKLAGAPALHRPTIADAADNPLFRPWHDPADAWGYTWPLPHTPVLDPQPEIVLQSITCKGLILPYMVYEV